MNYDEAIKEAENGSVITRESWDECRIVRKAAEGDYEFINYPVEGVMVDACAQRQCDCKIIIYRSNKEEREATDWIIKQ